MKTEMKEIQKKPNSVDEGIIVAQNVRKLILVLKFLKSNEIL